MPQNRKLTSDDTAVFIAIAQALGDGWFYSQIQSHPYCAQLCNRTLKHAYICIVRREHDYSFSCGIDRGYYSHFTAVQMRAVLHRQAPAIAADIQRRLLPELRVHLDIARLYLARKTATQERHQWLANCLQKLCSISSSGAHSNKLYDVRYANGITGTVKESCVSEYDLTLNHLSLDDVIRVMALVGPSQRGQQLE